MAVVNVMTFPPDALHTFNGTMSPSEDSVLLHCHLTLRPVGQLPEPHQLFLLYYRLFNLLSVIERKLRISRVANYS